jgi:S1-C subfamily serine protease
MLHACLSAVGGRRPASRDRQYVNGMTDWRPLPQLSGAGGGGEAEVAAPGTPGWVSRWWGRRGLLAAAALAVAVVAIVALVVGLHASSKPTISRSAVTGIANSTVGKAITQLQQQPPAGVNVYNQIAPAMVIVQAQGPGVANGTGALGSGVIVNTRGEILTAFHVVRNATSVKVTFADGSSSTANVLFSDAAHDIATLVPAHPPGVVVTAVLGGGVNVGDNVFAVGHPLGLVDTLTAGVVSGLNRSFQAPGGANLTGLIQFDAAVNPGNSGGPLLNQQGQVVGIVTGLANPTGQDDFVGIGFAVPIATAGGGAGVPNK